jgi:bacteriocin-like protein
MAKAGKSTKKGKPIASPDDLLKTSKEGSVELTEDELKKVSGGAAVDFFAKTKG